MTEVLGYLLVALVIGLIVSIPVMIRLALLECKRLEYKLIELEDEWEN